MADVAAPAPDNDQQPAASVMDTAPQPAPGADGPTPGSEPAGIAGGGETMTATAEAASAIAEPAVTMPAPQPEPTSAASLSAAADMPAATIAFTAAAPVAAASTPAPAPESTSEPMGASPEPVAAAPAPAPVAVPSIASTTEIPASSTDSSQQHAGGEWDLLVEKISQWINSGALQQQWQSVRTPLSLLAGLIALLLMLRVYDALLNVIDSLPLLPGLLELAGVVAVTRFSLRRLVRSDSRRQLFEDLRQRWQAFRGQP